MDENSISLKIIRNTVFNIAGRSWSVLVSLALTPYILHRIGMERFGIWALVGSLTGYFSLLDFGVGSSFVKYIAEFNARKEHEKVNQLVNSGWMLYSILGILIMAAALLLVRPLFVFLKIPAHLFGEAVFVFLSGTLLFIIANALSPFAAIQGGLQRMDISNKIAAAISIPSIIGTILFLKAGYGLPGLMINNAIILIISSILNIIAAFKVLPGLRIDPFLSDWRLTKKLFRYGIKVYITRLEGILTYRTDVLLIAYFLNIRLVSLYQLGNTIVDKARELPLLFVSAVVPAASEIEAKKDKKRLYELYVRGTKYISMAGMPLLTFVFSSANLIMAAWMNEVYAESVLVIRILVPCYLINILTGVSFSMVLGMGKPEILTKISIFQAIANLLLSIVLVIKIGFAGVVIATLISLTLSSVWFMAIFHRQIEYPLSGFVRKVFIKPFMASVFCGGLLFAFNSGIARISVSSGRLFNMALLILEAAVFTCFYALIILRLGYLDDYDKNIIKKRIFLSGFSL